LLKPHVETRLGLKISEDAILSSLKRMITTRSSYEQDIFEALANSSVQLSTGLIKIVTRTSSMKHISELLHSLNVFDSIFFSVGTDYITMIMEETKVKLLKEFNVYEIVDKRDKLGIISIRSTPKMLTTPGFLMYIYEKLATSGINVEETTNSYTDTIVVVSESQLDASFHAIMELIEYGRLRMNMK
jgi:aspartokinase